MTGEGCVSGNYAPHEKVKFTVSVRGRQWSSARHVHETLEEFARVIQRNARRLDFIGENDRIQRLQLARPDGSEPEELDVDATLEDVIICMGNCNKNLMAIVIPASARSRFQTPVSAAGSKRREAPDNLKLVDDPSSNINSPTTVPAENSKIQDQSRDSIDPNTPTSCSLGTLTPPSSSIPTTGEENGLVSASLDPDFQATQADAGPASMQSLRADAALAYEPPVRGLKITIPSMDPNPSPAACASVLDGDPVSVSPHVDERIAASVNGFERAVSGHGEPDTLAAVRHDQPKLSCSSFDGSGSRVAAAACKTSTSNGGIGASAAAAASAPAPAVINFQSTCTPSPAELAHFLVKGCALPQQHIHQSRNAATASISGNNSNNNSNYNHPVYRNSQSYGPAISMARNPNYNIIPGHGFRNNNFASTLLSNSSSSSLRVPPVMPCLPHTGVTCGSPPTDSIAMLAQFLASQLQAFVPDKNNQDHDHDEGANGMATESTSLNTGPDSDSPFNRTDDGSCIGLDQDGKAVPAAATNSTSAATAETNNCCHIRPRDAAADAYAAALESSCLRNCNGRYNSFGNGLSLAMMQKPMSKAMARPRALIRAFAPTVSNPLQDKDAYDTSSSDVNMTSTAAAPANDHNAGLKTDNSHGKSELIFFVNRRSKTGTGAHHLKLSDLSVFFHLSVVDAAKNLGVSQTTLKKACRKFGLKRWPGRKVRSLESTIHGLEHTIAVGQGAGMEQLTEAYMRSEVIKLQQEMDQLVHGTLAQQHSPVARTADLYKRLYSRGWRSKYHSPSIVLDLNVGNDIKNKGNGHGHALAPDLSSVAAKISSCGNCKDSESAQHPIATVTSNSDKEANGNHNVNGEIMSYQSAAAAARGDGNTVDNSGNEIKRPCCIDSINLKVQTKELAESDDINKNHDQSTPQAAAANDQKQSRREGEALRNSIDPVDKSDIRSRSAYVRSICGSNLTGVNGSSLVANGNDSKITAAKDHVKTDSEVEVEVIELPDHGKRDHDQLTERSPKRPKLISEVSDKVQARN